MAGRSESLAQLTLSRETLGERFDGVVVGLGALGVITSITLTVEPSFQMTQNVYENLSFSELEHHLKDIFGSGYSVRLFTDWQHHRATQVWVKRRVDSSHDQAHAAHHAEDFFGATPATRRMHPIGDHSAENCTEQMGIVRPW